MNVLVGCEFSGTVRDAFASGGHAAWSCDLLPTEKPGPHFEGDICNTLRDFRHSWDIVILHPPCTALAVSGNAHYGTGKPKNALRAVALEWTLGLWHLACERAPMVALENPVGVLSDFLGEPTQTIQPHGFGHDASKTTCLWLRGLPRLLPAHFIRPRMVAGRPRWENQTDSGQNKLAPSPNRWKKRSVTYPGIAAAMASQWGGKFALV